MDPETENLAQKTSLVIWLYGANERQATAAFH